MIDLKKFRKEKKIGQAEICLLFGIGQPYLSQIEKGDRPLNEEKLNLLIERYGDDVLKYKQNIGNETETNKPEILTNKESDEMEKMKMKIAHLEKMIVEKDQRILELNDRIEGQKEIIASYLGNSSGLKQTAR